MLVHNNLDWCNRLAGEKKKKKRKEKRRRREEEEGRRVSGNLYSILFIYLFIIFCLFFSK